MPVRDGWLPPANTIDGAESVAAAAAACFAMDSVMPDVSRTRSVTLNGTKLQIGSGIHSFGLEIPLLFTELGSSMQGNTLEDEYTLPVIAAVLSECRSLWVFMVDGEEPEVDCALDVFGSVGAVRFDFHHRYIFREPIGCGGHGQVYRGERHGSPRVASEEDFVAVKVLESGKDALAALRKEVSVLSVIEHPHLPRFFGLFLDVHRESQSDQKSVLVLQYFSGGDLHDRISAVGPLGEKRLVELTRGVFSALAHLHGHQIVHRDVKAENILISASGSSVLTDFGVSVFLNDAEGMLVRCGSPGYAAPEILSGQAYGPKVDLFSAGVSLYFAMCATLPFSAPTIAAVLRKTVACQVQFSRPQFLSLSNDALRCLQGLLQKDASDRPSALEALGSAWLASAPDAPEAGDTEAGETDPGVACILEQPVVRPTLFTKHRTSRTPSVVKWPVRQPSKKHVKIEQESHQESKLPSSASAAHQVPLCLFEDARSDLKAAKRRFKMLASSSRKRRPDGDQARGTMSHLGTKNRSASGYTTDVELEAAGSPADLPRSSASTDRSASFGWRSWGSREFRSDEDICSLDRDTRSIGSTMTPRSTRKTGSYLRDRLSSFCSRKSTWTPVSTATEPKEEEEEEEEGEEAFEPWLDRPSRIQVPSASSRPPLVRRISQQRPFAGALQSTSFYSPLGESPRFGGPGFLRDSPRVSGQSSTQTSPRVSGLSRPGRYKQPAAAAAAAAADAGSQDVTPRTSIRSGSEESTCSDGLKPLEDQIPEPPSERLEFHDRCLSPEQCAKFKVTPPTEPPRRPKGFLRRPWPVARKKAPDT